MNLRQRKLKDCKRVVVKIGSALLTNNGNGVDAEAIQGWSSQVAQLRKKNIEVLLVSSGSVAQGMKILDLSERPKSLYELQAAAAVGQMGLIHVYQGAFQEQSIHTAQVLLTHDDIKNRKRYLNARHTLRTLLELKVVPIINENDTVATEEICFGDNDTLAGMVACLVDADVLIILTDQEGLYTCDPRESDRAELVHEARVFDPVLDEYAKGSGGALGRGGMATKIKAARIGAQQSVHTIIANGRRDDVLIRIIDGESIGTILSSNSVDQEENKKQWLSGKANLEGEIVLADSVIARLKSEAVSVYPIDVVSSKGRFERGDRVSCITSKGVEIARGLTNYNSEEVEKIKGVDSDQLEKKLGYQGNPELIHRDNLIPSIE
jgi:glutamate 5-kinase